MAKQVYRGYEIRGRLAWGGGVTAVIFHGGRQLHTCTANDKDAAEQRARNWIDSKGGDAQGES